MEYLESPPMASLAPFVDCLWTLTGDAAELDGGSQPVLPDGRSELVLHFGDPFERVTADGVVSRQPAILFAGQLTAQLTLRPTGSIAVLGVRFHPFGAAALVDVPQHQLTGLTIGVDDLSGPLARALERVRAMTGDPRGAVDAVQRALENCRRDRPLDPRVRLVTETILRAGGAVSIEGLASRACVSRRHLERRFLDAVGVSPKRLARITRFQRALAVLGASDSPRRGVVTATTCGYADQSHFIREFRELAGCSPAEHLLRRGELTGFFVTEDRRSSHRR